MREWEHWRRRRNEYVLAMLAPIVPFGVAALVVPALTDSPWPFRMIMGAWVALSFVVTFRLMCVRCPRCRRRFYWGWGIGWFFEGRDWQGGLRESCFHCGARENMPIEKKSR